jgi:hypothetical protein
LPLASATAEVGPAMSAEVATELGSAPPAMVWMTLVWALALEGKKIAKLQRNHNPSQARSVAVGLGVCLSCLPEMVILRLEVWKIFKLRIGLVRFMAPPKTRNYCGKLGMRPKDGGYSVNAAR